MTTPSEEEARVALDKLHRFSFGATDEIQRTDIASLVQIIGDALASRVSTPPSEDDESPWVHSIVGDTGWFRDPDLTAGWGNQRKPIDVAEAPVIESWEYATISEITTPQIINEAHIDYWRNLGFEIIRRRRASVWEPVPAVPVIPTEPEGGSFQPLGDGFYRVGGVARDAMTGRYRTASTEPKEKQ